MARYNPSMERLDFATTSIPIPAHLQPGIALCRGGRWQDGLSLLKQAASQDESGFHQHPLAVSYLGYGIARFDRQIHDGLELCRAAAKRQFYEPEIQINLARTHMLAGNRREAVSVLTTGLKLYPGHRGLETLRGELGVRRRPVLGFLSRDNFLNRLLGRLRHSRGAGKKR